MRTVAAELALDDAMLAEARDAFRVWEPAEFAVVLGRSTPADEVIDTGAPVVRRSSGGGAVLLGPGCLCFSLVLRFNGRPALHDVAWSHQWILSRVAAALDLPGLSVAGYSDLALDGRKVSGNAQRRTRDAVLHHGVLLLEAFPLGRIAACLREPKRQPAYRGARTHAEFLIGLPLDAESAEARLIPALRTLLVRDSRFPRMSE